MTSCSSPGSDLRMGIGYRHAPRAHRVLVKLRVRIEPPGESRDCSAHGPRSSGEESPVVSFKSGPN